MDQFEFQLESLNEMQKIFYLIGDTDFNLFNKVLLPTINSNIRIFVVLFKELQKLYWKI